MYEKITKKHQSEKIRLYDPAIAYFLINQQVDYAILFTKKLTEEANKLEESYDIESSGLILNLLIFLLTNRLSDEEKRKILENYVKKLNITHYAGWFTPTSWEKIINVFMMQQNGILDRHYFKQVVCQHTLFCHCFCFCFCFFFWFSV